MVERQNSYDGADTGDYGEIPAELDYSSSLLKNTPEPQFVGKKIISKVDIDKSTTLIAGTSVAIGAIAGGIAIKEFRKRSR